MGMSEQRACSLRPAELGHSRAGVRSAGVQQRSREHARVVLARGRGSGGAVP